MITRSQGLGAWNSRRSLMYLGISNKNAPKIEGLENLENLLELELNGNPIKTLEG